MSIFTTISREYKYLRGILRMLRAVKTVSPDSDNLLPDDIESWVDKHKSNVAFVSDKGEWTYQAFDDYANRVANWALSENLKPGDTVGVFARNRLEYVGLWFGLTKVGVVPALMNYQLAGTALAHCVNISDARCVICDSEYREAFDAARKEFKTSPKVFSAFNTDDVPKTYEDFDAAISLQLPNRPPRSHRAGIVAGDQSMKMFTSGTTGLPKAAKVTHIRAQNYMRGFGASTTIGARARMLMVLPMYHATGGLCGIGAALANGGTVIVREKFSASRFWDEAVEYDATMFMYVGELCRFLLSTPAHPKERSHKIEWIIGNGLRPDVWEGFVSRFDIPHVVEFYGATEGNVSLLNIDGPVGAVGRIPNYLKSRFNCDIIRFDVETNENVRGADGFCIRTEDDEVGELIGEIRMDEGRFRFDGYEKKSATQKKILKDVFKKGDSWFRTGDLLRKDNLGYYYFVDRVGDTFRWKAENVATGEVAAILSKYPGVTQANVYGVEIPGYDGRAGMAAIVSEKDIDMAALRQHIAAGLPHYAQPVFIRLSQESDTTGTFKFKKTNLVKAGFNPANISDPLYVHNEKQGGYDALTEDVYQAILSGEIRL